MLFLDSSGASAVRHVQLRQQRHWKLQRRRLQWLPPHHLCTPLPHRVLDILRMVCRLLAVARCHPRPQVQAAGRLANSSSSNTHRTSSRCLKAGCHSMDRCCLDHPVQQQQQISELVCLRHRRLCLPWVVALPVEGRLARRLQ